MTVETTPGAKAEARVIMVETFILITSYVLGEEKVVVSE